MVLLQAHFCLQRLLASLNGYQYRCIATVLCTTTAATSNIATLTLGSPTTILANPMDATVCNGDPVSFSVTVQATTPTYQWQVHDGTGYYNLSNTGIYSGVNTSVLNISSATSGYQHLCIPLCNRWCMCAKHCYLCSMYTYNRYCNSCGYTPC